MPDDPEDKKIQTFAPKLLLGPDPMIAWAGQTADLSDARQPLPDPGYNGNPPTIIMWDSQTGPGRVVAVAPWVISRPALNVAGSLKCESFQGDIRVYFGVFKSGPNIIIPEDMHPGDSPIFTIDPQGVDGLVYAKVTVFDDGDQNDGLAKKVEIVALHVPPVDAQPIYYCPLGSYSVSGGVLTVTPGGEGNGIGDTQFELCGGLGGKANFWRI